MAFWLPARGYLAVQACADDIPKNLNFRVWATTIDGPPPKLGPTTSTITITKEPAEGIFPAQKNGRECGEWRGC